MKQNRLQAYLTQAGAAWRRAFDALRRYGLRFAAWQQRGTATPVMAEAGVETCRNCHETFTGHYCPNCGQQAGTARLTLRPGLRQIFEVWGLGNRNFPLTLLHLLLRPGYLISDYLTGKRVRYFPPVKLLFLMTTFYLLTYHFLVDLSAISVAPDAFTASHSALAADGQGAAGAATFGEALWANMVDFQIALNKNGGKYLALQLLFSHCLFALLACRLFRKSPRHPNLNFTEHLFAQVFMASQFMLLSILYILLFTHSEPHEFYDLPAWLLFAICCFDFKQLYGFSLLRTVWKTAVLVFLFFLILSFLVLLPHVVYTALTL